MALLIQNGEIVTGTDRYFGDIYVEDETITRIGAGIHAPNGAEVIDATGKLIFPGFIDPHVHIHLPFMGTFRQGQLQDSEHGCAGGWDDNADRDVLSVAAGR